jgi:hypothetical protein
MGIDEFKQNTTPHIIWSAASMNGKESKGKLMPNFFIGHETTSW